MFRRRKRQLLSYVPARDKTSNWVLSRRSRATKAKKCTKKRDARAKLLFGQSRPIAFLPFSLLSLSLLLKFPIDHFSPLSLVTVPQVFAKVFSSQFPTRF